MINRDLVFVSLAFGVWVVLFQMPLIGAVSPYFTCIVLSLTSQRKKYLCVVTALTMIYLSPTFWSVYNYVLVTMVSLLPNVQESYSLLMDASVLVFIYLSVFALFMLEVAAAEETVRALRLRERIGLL